MIKFLTLTVVILLFSVILSLSEQDIVISLIQGF
jgi:hypothetical protein